VRSTVCALGQPDSAMWHTSPIGRVTQRYAAILNIAKTLGLIIPDKILAIADQVFE
jgi:hypothetical protein